MKKDGPPRPERPFGASRVLRAVLIGVAVFVLLNLLPGLLLSLQGVDLSGPPAVQDDEPVYRDASGKRIRQVDHEVQSGMDLAQAQGIASHAACKAAFAGSMKALGCHRHVTRQKNIPPHVRQGNWIGGKTTAQCIAEVDAHWGAAIQDLREQGDHHAAEVWTRKDWLPERQQCQNYDNVRIGTVVHQPMARIERLLQQLDRGEPVSAQDKAVVIQDLNGVHDFPDGPDKRDYLAKVDLFLQRTAGR